jgi:hypothetical protein
MNVHDSHGRGGMAETTDEILVHVQYIREAQDRTNAHLATLNGRVGSAETRIAVMESKVERRNQPREVPRRMRDMGKGAMIAAATGALIALAGALKVAEAVLTKFGETLAK